MNDQHTNGSIKDRAKGWLTHVPGLYRATSFAYRSMRVVRGMAQVAERADALMRGARPLVISYPSEPRPRWGHGHPGHARLASIIGGSRAEYERMLRAFGSARAAMEAVPEVSPQDSPEPSWRNGFFSGLDAAALYGMIATQKPRRYFEIGSGHSTKFARRAIRDQGLSTTLLSIDPSPQATVDALCDRVIRQPLEDVDLALFDELEAGDILFFDGSHYAVMNSDVVVLWLDIIPRIKPGVFVHVHDIFLPYDYPADWVERFYSEQYLLAVALLARDRSLEIVFPNYFIGHDAALTAQVAELLGPRATALGASCWLKTRATPAQ